MATEKKKTCFIIMPISTPEHLLPAYGDDKHHFNHVLECLFVPSVEAAGFEAIRPASQGSDLIHARIITDLERADLVLCDMSGLNPNVFFEFGIRTALNKPVCVVKDDQTPKVPFDATVLNYHEYGSAMNLWEADEERRKLVMHLTQSADGSGGVNSLWRYFGVRTAAAPFKGENEDMGLAMQSLIMGRLESIESDIREALSASQSRLSFQPEADGGAGSGSGVDDLSGVHDLLMRSWNSARRMSGLPLRALAFRINDQRRTFRVTSNAQIPEHLAKKMVEQFRRTCGYNLQFAECSIPGRVKPG